MRKKLDNPKQLNIRVEDTLKTRLEAESNRQDVELSVMLREWLTADVSAAESARGITWTPAVPVEPVTVTPEAEKFAVSTLGDQTPPPVDLTSMPSQPEAIAGPQPMRERPPRMPGFGEQPQPPQQENTANEAPE